MVVLQNNSLVTLDNLKSLIKNIAEINAIELSSENVLNNCELNVDELADKIFCLHLFDGLNKVSAKEQIKFLSDSLKKIITEEALVKDKAIGNPVPLAYEVLKVIFLQTSEKFRQNYLHKLIDFYYKELCDALEISGAKYSLKKPKLESQIKYLLPLVKFETLLQIKDDSDLVNNIINYFNNPRMNQEDIYAVVKNNIGTLDFDLISYEFIPLDQRNGHMGDYFQLKIEINHNEEHKKCYLFAKFLTSHFDFLQELLKLGPSKKEEFFYMVYLRKLKELGYEDLLDFAPNCYFSRVDDVIILDDMTQKGFIGLTPNIKLNYDALKLGVSKIAKLHCCSLLLEQNIPSLYETYNEFLQEIFYITNNDLTKKTMGHVDDMILYLCTKFPEIIEKYSQEQLKKKLENGWNIVNERVKKSNKLHNVICHGDMYVANMLFKYDQDQICEDVSLIDFQILRYCPPTLDLMFFLHQTTFKDTLDKHKDDLLEEYYTTLSKSLKKYHFNSEEIYPKHEFYEAVKYGKIQGVFQSFVYTPIQMIEPKVREAVFQEGFKQMQADKYYLLNMGMENENYRRAVKGLLEQFIELCDNDEI